MSTEASVHSIEALKDLRGAMSLFADDVLGALGAVDMEVRRTQQWLHNDRRMYWEGQIKKRREQVAMARSELSRRKMSGMFGHAGSYSEQQELVKKAEA